MPNEEVKEQVNAAFRNVEGILLLTNVRLLWKRVGDTVFQISVNRLNIKSAQDTHDVQSNRYLIKIDVHE